MLDNGGLFRYGKSLKINYSSLWSGGEESAGSGAEAGGLADWRGSETDCVLEWGYGGE